MSRTMEMVQEQRIRALHNQLVKAIEFDLAGSVAHAGGELTGFSVRLREWETLVTLRAIFPAGAMYAHCGSETLAHALVKAASAARADALTWKADKWVKE